MHSINDILLKHLNGELTPSEQVELERWLGKDEANRALFNRLNDTRFMSGLLEKMDQMDEEAVWQKIVAQRSLPAPVIRRYAFLKAAWMKYAAAAVVIIGLGAWLFFSGNEKVAGPALPVRSVSLKNDVAPGGNGAVLTLADGSTIVLDSAGNGVLASQGNTKVIKLANGQLVYQNNGLSDEPLFNTLTTARGKQFHVVLPDGTKVWLNASSSLNYPMAFTGKQRKVSITGEAYFEIAKDVSRPFIVTTARGEVTALGTSFNINAYEDEGAVKTTLLEGSVRIAHASSNVLLTPGQQSVIAGAATSISVREADVQQAVAWKNGYFAFINADIKIIMRQLSRWYDVEVVYESNVPKVEFSGEIGRTLSLAQLLDILKETRIHYRIEEKKLVIMP